MIFDVFSDLNWPAILVAALAWFVFSAVWYSAPPLSKAWQREARVTMPDKPPSMVPLLIPTFVAYVVTSAVIAMLVRAIGTTEAMDAVALGVTLGVAFGVVGALLAQLYEMKGGLYWLINGLNWIIAFSIVAVIVTVWD